MGNAEYMGKSLQLEFTTWEVIMIAKVFAVSCLLASLAQAAPKADPQFLLPSPLALAPPALPANCKVENKEVTLKSCGPKTEKVCDTIEVKRIEVTYEKKCEEVKFKSCYGKREAEADPQFLYPGLVYHDCPEVTTERCSLVPTPNEVSTPVENCHLVYKVGCEDVTHEVPEVVCDPALGHPFRPSFLGAPVLPAAAPAEAEAVA